MTYWAMSDEALQEYAARVQATAVSQAFFDRLPGEKSPVSITDGVATIRVSGPMAQQFDPFMALIFGSMTSYAALVQAAQAAQADPRVKAVEFDYDTPGGNVAGLYETAKAINAITKPKRAIVRNAHSAGYVLAANSGEIIASSPASSVGSVGVVARVAVSQGSVEITSTEAPDKRPDPTSAEGQAVIRAYLDEQHDLLIESISQGSGASKETINEKYGRGRSFLAREALNRGMVHKIAGDQRAADTPREIIAMKFDEYQAAHPQEAAKLIDIGVARERERVQAHLLLGEQAGAPKIAVEAINAGADFGPLIMAKYNGASMARQMSAERQEDNSGTPAAAAAPVAVDLGDLVAKQILGEAK